MFGVAPSATAAEVLAEGTGIDADTYDKLLIEHRLDRPPEHRYNLPPATTIIVDEAGMVPTTKLAELFDLADRKGWRLALVGDPLQFAPVGRGGMFGLLVDPSTPSTSTRSTASTNRGSVPPAFSSAAATPPSSTSTTNRDGSTAGPPGRCNAPSSKPGGTRPRPVRPRR